MVLDLHQGSASRSLIYLPRTKFALLMVQSLNFLSLLVIMLLGLEQIQWLLVGSLILYPSWLLIMFFSSPLLMKYGTSLIRGMSNYMVHSFTKFNNKYILFHKDRMISWSISRKLLEYGMSYAYVNLFLLAHVMLLLELTNSLKNNV